NHGARTRSDLENPGGCSMRLRPILLVVGLVVVVGAGGAVAPLASPFPTPLRNDAAVSAGSGARSSLTWPTFGRTQQRSFHGRTTLPKSTVSSLQQRWFVSANDAVTATPIVANGVV